MEKKVKHGRFHNAILDPYMLDVGLRTRSANGAVTTFLWRGNCFLFGGEMDTNLQVNFFGCIIYDE